MSSPGRISIVTSGPLCRNPRALKEAQTLGAAGYDVTVFTVAHWAQYEQMDAELVSRAPFRKVSLRLMSATGRPKLRLFAARSATWAARRLARYGVQSDRAFGPVDSLTRLVRRSPADLTIVHTELGLAVARRLSGSSRCIAADFEDWHSRDLLPEAQQSRPGPLLQVLERDLLNRSRFTLTTSDAMADALNATYGGGRPYVIRNTFPLQILPDRPPARPPTFFWFSQTVGPGRGLEAFVSAWNLMAEPSRLSLLGQPVAGYPEAFSRRVSEARRSALEFLPLVSPTELPATIARYGIGLALEPPQPANKDLTVSNKLFQYLNAGLAVLATNTAGHREIAPHTDGGIRLISVADPRALASELDQLVRDEARLQAMGRASRRAAERLYCWEREAPKLLTAVRTILPRNLQP